MLKRHYRRTQDTVCHLAERSLDLCRDIDNDEPFVQAELVREALARTGQAQRIITIGEHGVGKSSLLSGLIEEPSIKAVGFETPCLCWRFLRSEDELPHATFPTTGSTVSNLSIPSAAATNRPPTALPPCFPRRMS